MNSLEIIRSKTTNEKEKEKSDKNLFHSTTVNIKITKKKFSKNKLVDKLKKTTPNDSNKNISKKQNIQPFSSKSSKNVLRKLPSNNSTKRHSLGLVQRNTIKYYNKFSIKDKKNTTSKNAKLKATSIQVLEKNIKNVINDIRVKIERKNKLLKRQKTLANNNFFNIIKKKNQKITNKRESQRRSYGMEELPKSQKIFDQIIVKKKRNFSYDFNELRKEKLMKKIQKKIFKKHKRKLSIASSDNRSDSDTDVSLIGFSIDPNSRFIFIFDLLLIIANLYYFISLPLNIARNEDIKNKVTILEEICYYFVDLIFLFDFLICLIRGYYNYQMKLILNNQEIIIHYLKRFFFSDLLESIPIYSIVKIFINKNYKVNFGESDYRYEIFKLYLFVKPFKTFKIATKKQNKALEGFYTYFHDNYNLEKLFRFLIYFFISILFIHLFICLHIYLAYKSYPNWLSYTNNIDSDFYVKYLTSFYFMITTMTTVGYGDIICISFIERIYHIFLLAIGTLLYTFIVSKIGNYLREESHEQIRLAHDLNVLESIRISYPKMPYELYSKIQSHLVATSKKRKTSGISILINGIPETIKKDLLFKIYSKVIRGFTIFRQANNSNFIYQVLTSFIPIVSKREEIILMEGEIIENIIFVKDGLLTLEIRIDLKDPYKSIRHYIETNFIGISRKEGMKKYSSNYVKRNSVFSIGLNNNNNNYEDLKLRIDNILLDKKDSMRTDSKKNLNDISMDIARMDFSREPIELDNERFKIIKVMDIRKNEYFGDIHMFLEQRSPFTIRTKTRISELLFMRKNDALNLSRNFPNVCRRIQKKSYHNILSIKNKTFKMLREYYDSYLFKKKRKSIRLNISGQDNLSKFLAQNIQDKNNINSVIPNNSFKKKNNLSKRPSKISKITKKSNNDNSLIKEFNCTIESNNSNYIRNSQFQLPKKPIKTSTKDIIQYQKDQSLNIINTIESSKTNRLEINDLKEEIKELEHTFSNPKSLFGFHKSKTKNSKYKSSKIINKKNNDLFNSKEYNKTNTEKMSINKTIEEVLSLKNNNGNLSKKIEAELQKRKKIQKLIQYINMQKYKVDKNLVELYLRQDSIQRKSSNKVLIINQLNTINSMTSSKNKIMKKNVFFSKSEKNFSIKSKNFEKINKKKLNIVTTESFEIKSSYTNINFLSKGKMINDFKYKLFVEKFIKNIKNEDIYKIISPSLKKKDKYLSKKLDTFKMTEDAEKKVTKNNQYFSEKKFPLVSRNKNSFNGTNNLSKKNDYDNFKTIRNINSIRGLKSSKIMRDSLNFFDKNSEKLKLNNIGIHKKKYLSIKNDNNVVNNIKIYSIGKTSLKSKKTNKSKKEKGKSTTMEDCLNKLDELNKDNNSKNENISLFVDKNHDASGIKMINLKDTSKEKDDKCIIY